MRVKFEIFQNIRKKTFKNQMIWLPIKLSVQIIKYQSSTEKPELNNEILNKYFITI